MEKNKRGISAVVATVLIILITVAGVAIVGVIVIPMIKDNLESGTQCLDTTSQITIVNDYTCYNSSSENVSLQIKRGSKDSDLVGIQVLVFSKGNSEPFKINENLPTVPGEKVYQIDPNTVPVDQVQIAPIIKIGNKENICDISSTTVLKDC